MRFEWVLGPLVALWGFASAAQEWSPADPDDQLAFLVVANAPAQLHLRVRNTPVDLAYDVRNSQPAPAVRLISLTGAPVAGRADPSLDALGLPLQGDGPLVDLYPFQEGFRITAGARSDLNDARFVSRSRRGMSEADQMIADTLKRADEGFTPYLGIGYGRRLLDGRLEVALDAGLLFDREREGGGSATDGGKAFAVEGVELREVPGDGTSSDVYPVVGLSMKYQF